MSITINKCSLALALALSFVACSPSLTHPTTTTLSLSQSFNLPPEDPLLLRAHSLSLSLSLSHSHTMTVSDGLPTYEPVAGGETQLSQFPAAPQFGVESATPQPQMVYMAQPGSGFPANVQVVHVMQPPAQSNQDLTIAIIILIVGFFVPLAWLGGLFLWNRYSLAQSLAIRNDQPIQWIRLSD